MAAEPKAPKEFPVENCQPMWLLLIPPFVSPCRLFTSLIVPKLPNSRRSSWANKAWLPSFLPGCSRLETRSDAAEADDNDDPNSGYSFVSGSCSSNWRRWYSSSSPRLGGNPAPSALTWGWGSKAAVQAGIWMVFGKVGDERNMDASMCLEEQRGGDSDSRVLGSASGRGRGGQ